MVGDCDGDGDGVVKCRRSEGRTNVTGDSDCTLRFSGDLGVKIKDDLAPLASEPDVRDHQPLCFADV